MQHNTAGHLQFVRDPKLLQSQLAVLGRASCGQRPRSAKQLAHDRAALAALQGAALSFLAGIYQPARETASISLLARHRHADEISVCKLHGQSDSNDITLGLRRHQA